ncbi:MAG: cobalt ECF transporter T component CbiQ [Dehalococcoidales bacterium]|nr:MAG: cobalt ECF transporter T component CbiQ [Dehalococcoidales bacterium]
MKHAYLDQYSDIDSYFHRLDARTKLIYTFVFILLVVLTPPDSWLLLGFYALITVILILTSKLPPVYVIKRSLVVMPFVILIAVFTPFFKEGEVIGSTRIWIWDISVTETGVLVFRNVLAKAWLSITSLIWLTATTKITHILYALERLHFPRVLVMILSFMYRYIFVIVDEVMRMKQARDSRNIGSKRLRNMRTIGNMIGTLFVRSYERSERVYNAMTSRGFDGQVRVMEQLQFSRADVIFFMSFGLIMITAGILNLVI